MFTPSVVRWFTVSSFTPNQFLVPTNAKFIMILLLQGIQGEIGYLYQGSVPRHPPSFCYFLVVAGCSLYVLR